MASRKKRKGSLIAQMTGKNTRDTIAIADITLKKGLQPRDSEDMDLIHEYASTMKVRKEDGIVVDNSGREWPPIVIFEDSNNAYLVDGWHRYYAAKKKGVESFQVDRHRGNYRDALAYSLGVNAQHGKRRTNSDKRRVVEKALGDREWNKLSNIQIASMCAVSDRFVGKIRKELEARNAIEKRDKIVTASGRTVDASNIGARPRTKSTPNDSESTYNSVDPNAQEKVTVFVRKQDEDELVPVIAQDVLEDSPDTKDKEQHLDDTQVQETRVSTLDRVNAWRDITTMSKWHKAAMSGRQGQVIITPLPRPDLLTKVVNLFEDQIVPPREYAFAEDRVWVVWSIQPLPPGAPSHAEDLTELIQRYKEVLQ